MVRAAQFAAVGLGAGVLAAPYTESILVLSDVNGSYSDEDARHRLGLWLRLICPLIGGAIAGGASFAITTP